MDSANFEIFYQQCYPSCHKLSKKLLPLKPTTEKFFTHGFQAWVKKKIVNKNVKLVYSNQDPIQIESSEEEYEEEEEEEEEEEKEKEHEEQEKDEEEEELIDERQKEKVVSLNKRKPIQRRKNRKQKQETDTGGNFFIKITLIYLENLSYKFNMLNQKVDSMIDQISTLNATIKQLTAVITKQYVTTNTSNY